MENITLQLGDIIKIFDTTNQYLNNEIFFISYLDENKIVLININTGKEEKLIIENGVITTIRKIILLSRLDSPSYAVQNGLLVGIWIDIYFSGEYPFILTGEITNLEEDMIEIKTPENEVLYINFDYKGIPDELNIQKIVIREKPMIRKESIEIEEPITEEQLLTEEKPLIQKNRYILQADQIKFGNEELLPIHQMIDVSYKQKIYSLEEQLSDLLDNFISNIPNNERTPNKINDINIYIQRFRSLREKYSVFDNYGNVIRPIQKNYKPLTQYFKNFETPIYWILPVVMNKKKIYMNKNIIPEEIEETDVIILPNYEQIIEIQNLTNEYKSNNIGNEGNKYSNYYSNLNPFFTPFINNDDEYKRDIIVDKEVNGNIFAVVNNLENMYSSAFSKGNINSIQFQFQQYNNGLTKLETLPSTSKSILLTKKIQLTSPDIMNIRGFIIFPEPIIHFSKLNLPDTTILQRSNLNAYFIQYWKLLNKQTNLKNIVIDLQNEINNEYKFDHITYFQPDINNVNDKNYDNFVNKIIPKTNFLFQWMKKYIHNKFTFVDIVESLEPFYIYTDDIIYSEFQEINKFINEEITKQNKLFLERQRNYFRFMKENININLSPLPIIENITIKESLRELVLDIYQLNLNKNTNSEILLKIINLDYLRLYTTILSYQNIILIYPEIVDIILKSETSPSVDCKKIRIAKTYRSLDDLFNDNQIIIYYDKKYDTTDYEEYETNYEKQISTMNPEELKKYIIRDLMIKKKMDETSANYLANTYLDGRKMVINGDYAILYKTKNADVLEEVDYYVRENNEWKIDNTIKKDIHTISDDSNILCNLQKQCIAEKEKCVGIPTEQIKIQTNLYDKIVNEFDKKYSLSKEEQQNLLKQNKENYLNRIHLIRKLKLNENLLSNKIKYELGKENNIIITEITEAEELLNIILKEEDFIKKQYDLVSFANKYTRQANNTENIHWYYNIETNTPILPIFKIELANAFIQGNFQECLEKIKTTIGTISDDGDWWCDKHSGWQIVRVDFSYEEGYEDGFKISSRELLGEDISIIATKQINTFTLPEVRIINNIINSLSVAMNISIETQKEFIINGVLVILNTKLETEKDYQEKVQSAAKKGKKLPPYKDLYNKTILYSTLAFYFVAIQTAIPTIQTRKTFPGCIRSFSGFPFSGEGDYSGLNYLACVTHALRQSTEPWNILKKQTIESISETLKTIINSFLYGIPFIKQQIEEKIEEKNQYLLTHSLNDIISEEHNIANWKEFLPPLLPFRISVNDLQVLTQEFKQIILSNIKKHSQSQYKDILSIASKIIFFSLEIQVLIQKIVHQEDLLLNSNNKVPYIENACCETNDKISTIEYFINKERDISKYNENVKEMTFLLEDIGYLAKSKILYSTINTRLQYPSLNNIFQETIIYQGFIHFCKYNSLLPIPSALVSFCIPNKPNFKNGSSLDIMIQQLKQLNVNYTIQDFLLLLQAVSGMNIVFLLENTTRFSIIQRFLLELNKQDFLSIDTQKIIEENIIRENTNNINNLLIKNIEDKRNILTDFIRRNYKNISMKKTKRTIYFIENVLADIDHTKAWNMDIYKNENISNDKLYSISKFFNNYIHNIGSIFPNILLNKVKYTYLLIPKYYGFSKNHTKKLIKNINEYYEPLYPLMDLSVEELLKYIQEKSKMILLLSDKTPGFSTNDSTPFNERTTRLFMQYYLLSVFEFYIKGVEEGFSKDIEKKDITSITEDIIVLDTPATLENQDTQLILNNAMNNTAEIRLKVVEMISAFIEIMEKEKEEIDITYENIQDRVFKLKEREKNMVTDRLKNLTDEERDADTMLKIHKLDKYNLGLQKGLTILDADYYDNELYLREEMVRTEKELKKRNKQVTEENIDFYIDDFLQEKQTNHSVNEETYHMSGLFGEDEDDYIEDNMDDLYGEYDNYHGDEDIENDY